MAFSTLTSDNRGVWWADHAGIQDLSQMTLSFWFYINAIRTSSYGDVFTKYSTAPNAGSSGSGWWIDIYEASGNHRMRFWQGFSVANGLWELPDDSLVVSTWYHLMLTYDRSSPSNDPTFYRDGETVAFSEIAPPPSGTRLSDVGYILTLGGTGTLNKSCWARIQDARMYNRILTQQEARILAKSRRMNILTKGLVFWAPVLGASGIQKFDGATLGGTNYLLDRRFGKWGTPAGSPTGVGNCKQTVSGEYF